jgi:hypothetical protein
MKHILLFLCTIATLNSHAQSNSNQTPEFNRFQVGINFSADACFRALKNSDGAASSDMVIIQRNNLETYRLGYTAGLNFCLNISEKFGIETGVQYSLKGFQQKNKI